jgi:hypothetical protein
MGSNSWGARVVSFFHANSKRNCFFLQALPRKSLLLPSMPVFAKARHALL